jgi:tRNA G18 (ribose-2'-O)-methylase SpoU
MAAREVDAGSVVWGRASAEIREFDRLFALWHAARGTDVVLGRRLPAILREAGFTVVGLDEKADRTVYDERAPDGRIAVVIGSEGEGLARLTRETCDVLVSLPMRGRIGSLNASAALAAVLFAYVVPRGSAATDR